MATRRRVDTPTPTNTPPAVSRAYAHVKGRLLEGGYEDGELLSEGAIATELGMSRTPVREALLQLQSEQLLTLYPKRGALVTPVSVRDVAELYEARQLVERHCLRRAAGTEGLIEALDDAIAHQRAIVDEVESGAAMRPGERSAFADADREYHRIWVEANGNKVLLEGYDRLRDRQQRVAATLIRVSARSPRRLVEEHAEIVQALRENDVDKADAALARHLGASAAEGVRGG